MAPPGEGEFDLIARLRERLPGGGERIRVGSGDDAAVVDPGGRATVTTIDAIAEGAHFTLPEFPPAAVGRKALAAALSDLAAMGAEPGEAYIAVAAPERFSSDRLLELADGLAAVAEREGIAIAGGDLIRAPALMIAVTCVGYESEGAPLVRRRGAGAGDAVVVTGELGGAAAALELLRSGAAEGGKGEGEELLARQLDPRPRLAAGRALAASGATAMIDLSDGLGADAGHLARASGLRLEIELELLPVAAGIQRLAADEAAARAMVVSGGEDFELLATVPAGRIAEAEAAVAATGTGLTQIGKVRSGEGATIRDRGGAEVEAPGFDHMRGSRAGSG